MFLSTHRRIAGKSNPSDGDLRCSVLLRVTSLETGESKIWEWSDRLGPGEPRSEHHGPCNPEWSRLSRFEYLFGTHLLGEDWRTQLAGLVRCLNSDETRLLLS